MFLGLAIVLSAFIAAGVKKYITHWSKYPIAMVIGVILCVILGGALALVSNDNDLAIKMMANGIWVGLIAPPVFIRMAEKKAAPKPER
jgi:high-affinity Fe2+/Pb2+ permease